MFSPPTVVKYQFFYAPAYGIYWRLQKKSCRACLLFYDLFGDKKIVSRCPLTCTFIHLLLNTFDLPSYSSKSNERYTLRLLVVDISRSAGGRVLL